MTDYRNGKLEETRETVCVPVERYEKLILAERCMDTLAVQIAEDWSVAADNGYLEPTEFMKTLLAVYNPDLYASTAGAVERIKADNRMRREAAEPNAGDTETPPTDKGPSDWPPAPTVTGIDWTKRGTVTSVQTDLF